MVSSVKRFWLTTAILVAPFLLIGIFILIISVIALGTVSGTEFSPDDFSRRDFSYIRIPLLKWTVQGIDYEDVTSQIELSLVQDGFIAPQNPLSWHLCNEGNLLVQPNEADARLLVNLLNLPIDVDGYRYYWKKWNDDQPELARVFWPVIADMARDEMYLAIPDIMTFAMNFPVADGNAVDADQISLQRDLFQSELHELVVAAYRQHVDISRNLGNQQRCNTLCERIKQFQPTELDFNP